MNKRTKIILWLIALNSTAAVINLLQHHFFGSLSFSTVETTVSLWIGINLGMVIGVLVASKEMK